MTCEWAMLCQDIEQHREGGVSILGVYSNLLVKTLPITAALMLAARLLGAPGEAGVSSILVVDPSGQMLYRLPDETIATKGDGYLDFAVSLGPMTFANAGIHRAVIRIDDVELRSVQFPVNIARIM